jgi:hypothetical protein
MQQFTIIPSDELPSGMKCAASFETLGLNIRAYLHLQWHIFHQNGGRAFRGTVRHISQVLMTGTASFQQNLPASSPVPLAVCVCAGLGSRFLGGVDDADVYPESVQGLKLRAPWVTVGRALYEGGDFPSIYVIPTDDWVGFR